MLPRSLLLFVTGCAAERTPPPNPPGPTREARDAPTIVDASEAAPSATTLAGTARPDTPPAEPSSFVLPHATGSSDAPVWVDHVRPKGDGTCEASHDVSCVVAPCPPVVEATPCPVMPTAQSSDDTLGAGACRWAAGCDRVKDGGCCVGCSNPRGVVLTRACALAIVGKRDCKSVQAAWDACAH